MKTTRSTFKILFYLKRNILKKDGSVPVMCRVTVNGTISQFSCKFDVNPDLWDTKGGRVAGKSLTAKDINQRIDKIRVGINRHYQEIAEKDNYVTAEKIKNAYLGLGMKYETLLAVYRQHNEDFAKLVGKMRSKSTYQKYCAVYRHLEEFIKTRYRVKDISLKELKPAFIIDFEMFLRTHKDCCTNTIWTYMMPLRRMITIAINNGWLLRDPFVDYHIGPEETERGYLTKDEIRKLIDVNFTKHRRGKELTRDLYLFCIFTGLSYRDMKNLTAENLQTSFDGHLWIMTHRQKTGVQSNIRLMEIPRKILEKYDGTAGNGRLLPVPALSTLNTSIKRIAQICGIEKNLSWHISRHTMATEICLTNGMPIETLSKLLGHTNIKTTQIYAKITNEKVSRDMDALSGKLNDIDQFRDVKI